MAHQALGLRLHINTNGEGKNKQPQGFLLARSPVSVQARSPTSEEGGAGGWVGSLLYEGDAGSAGVGMVTCVHPHPRKTRPSGVRALQMLTCPIRPVFPALKVTLEGRTPV